MDVGDWLQSLGLGQYEAVFRDNGVDGAVLPKLTVDDIKELGVVGVGHRRKIIAAIEELSAPKAARTETVKLAPAANLISARQPSDSAERRQLTVMFCDLVGSTALSARLDPEDMRRVIRAYQDACSGVVARYDGFVAKFMGDGILAYFGFPRAHEDDAARAVHAGLELVEVIMGLGTPTREKLAARIGIATGLVVVGDIVGHGPAQEQAVVGGTPNLAARLQGLADAGGIVISASTRRLVGGRFRLRDMGQHALKGLPEPVEAFAALGVSPSDSRFEAAHATRLTGFVGREAEVRDLNERQRRAWGGQGQIVLIHGEAGIGKSRLSAWIAEQVAGTAHTKFRYQCSPYHRDSALYPFVQQFERAAAVTARDSPEAKLEKVEKVLALATDRLGEVAPLIAAMLSIPTGTRYPAHILSPAQRRRQTLFALLDQIEGSAKKQPVLMLFEDAHWADATSLEVLDLAIERVRKLPVLLLITFRPEFEAPWKGLPDVSEIALGRLQRSQAEALVERVTGGRKLPAEVLARIVAKTDGVPLFVEELTKNVLESGLLIEEADRYRLDGPLPPLAIPSTLHDSLMARLDRLAVVKEIAQIGAAIGREFSYSLLLAVVGRDEATLKASLAQLEESELVFRSGEPPAARYIFKHALVQDAAYESLLKSRRQILHQRIAEILRDEFADNVEAEPELLAHHFTQAGIAEFAVEYWGKAGDLALRRSAFKEAIAHLGKAIEMTEAVEPQEKIGARERLHLQVAYGNAMFAVRGFAAPETAAAFERARELADGELDSAERYSVIYGLWSGSYVRGELAPMRELSEVFLRGCSSRLDSPEASVAHRICGVTKSFAGEFIEARPFLEKALAIFDADRDADLAFQYGMDIGISAMIQAAIVYLALGEFELARRHVDAMATRLALVKHVGTLAYAYIFSAMYELIRGDLDQAAIQVSALSNLQREHELAQWTGFTRFLDGWLHWRAGGASSGISAMREGIALHRDQSVAIFYPLINALLALAESASGQAVAAIATLDQALVETNRTGQRWYDAELYRARAEIHFAQYPADAAPAETALLTAIAVAHHQKARSFKLRAAFALAKLYQSTGRPAAAREALGPALEGFAPTLEFPEIAQALSLLAETENAKQL